MDSRLQISVLKFVLARQSDAHSDKRETGLCTSLRLQRRDRFWSGKDDWFCEVKAVFCQAVNHKPVF